MKPGVVPSFDGTVIPHLSQNCLFVSVKLLDFKENKFSLFFI